MRNIVLNLDQFIRCCVDSSFVFQWIIPRPLYISKGVLGYNFQKYCIVLPEDLFLSLQKNEDPDEKPHHAAFHLGLQCL